MPAPSNNNDRGSVAKKHSSRRRHPSRSSQGTGFYDSGPPKEVIVKRIGDAEGATGADKVLDELLMNDDQSEVSSLGVGEARAVVSSRQKPDLDRVLGDPDEDVDEKHDQKRKSENGVGTRGLEAARERYRAQSSSRHHSRDTPLIQLVSPTASEDELIEVEQVSLGEPMKMGGSHIEVIDVEEIEESRKNEGAQTITIEKRNAPSDDTSKTASGTDDSPAHMTRKVPPRPEAPMHTKRKSAIAASGQEDQKPKMEPEIDDEEGDEQSTASDDSSDEGTKDLLDRAHDRLAVQILQGELDDLKHIVEKKNEEIKILAGQLRRAVETKCDLVLAHTEMEQYHEFTMQVKEEQAHQLVRANFGLQEGVASVERDLINEIVRLQVTMQDAKKQHVQELQDWERMHKNEMLERDCEIARLKAEVHKLILMRNPLTSSMMAGEPIPTELIEC